MHQKKIEVCLSPDLFHLYEDIENKVVVITDILRATSTICSAFNRGAEKVIPVASVEEAQELKNKGLRVAAERNGKTVEGFEFGNSPAQLTNYDLTNETFVITTTNGTKAIDLSKKASQIIIGSFLNLAATCEFLKEKNKDIICFCAGWKGKFSLEDTMFAGAVIHKLKNDFTIACDSGFMAEKLYGAGKDDLFEFLKNSSHFQRLSKFGIEEDLKYCMLLNEMDFVPVYKDGYLTIED